jgi:hypothetical protein
MNTKYPGRFRFSYVFRSTDGGGGGGGMGLRLRDDNWQLTTGIWQLAEYSAGKTQKGPNT